MTINPSRAATALMGALVLGAGADLLLRTTPWGLNAFLWILGLAAAASLTTRASPLDGGLIAPLVFFAGMIAWTDAPVLTAFNVLAAVGLLAVPIVCPAGRPLARIRARNLAAAGIRMARNVVTVPALVNQSGALRLPSGRILTSLAVGVAVTIPVSAVFVSLFAQADPTFEALTDRIFSTDLLGRGFDHLMFAVVFAWPAAAYLKGLIGSHRGAPAPRLRSPALGLPAVALPLGATMVIFASYLVIQARYLFGGAEFLATTPGLTTATYARSGFFELVAASTIVVPLLLGAEWVLGPARKYRRPFATLATGLIGLVVGVVGSAFHRMLLYWQSFGLSQDRVYATAFMTWIAFVLLWFGWTIITHRSGFLLGVVLSALVTLGAVDLANVDALVVRVNVSRVATDRPLDGAYHARGLSGDAVPALAARLDRLDPETRCAVVTMLADRWQDRSGDWRSWNVSRWRATSALGSPEVRAVREACAATGPGPEESPPPGERG